MTNPCAPSQPGVYPSDCEILEGYRTRVREGQATSPYAEQHQLVLAKAKEVRLLLLDVDGVLTDGTLLYSNDGQESKSFHTQDGFGLRLLQDAGIEVGIITARQSAIVSRRAEELKLRYVYQGIRKKIDAYQAILQQSGRRPFEVAYMGDDWLDLLLLQQVGLALAPANCVPEVAKIAHFITPRTGGKGAVRDACDLILTAQGKLTDLLQTYLSR